MLKIEFKFKVNFRVTNFILFHLYTARFHRKQGGKPILPRKLLFYVFLLLITAGLLSGCDLAGEPVMYEIDFEVEGEGEIIIDGENNEQEEQDLAGTSRKFEEDSSFDLTAEPAEGWKLQSWQLDGDYYSSFPQETFTAEHDGQKITAVFQRHQYELNLETTGEGEGEIKTEVIHAPQADEHPFETVIKLTAVPGDYSEFTGWSGDIGDGDSEDPEIKIEMDEDKNVSAKFELIEPATISGKIDIEHSFPFAAADDYSYASLDRENTGSRPELDATQRNLTGQSLSQSPDFEQQTENGEIVVGYDNTLTPEQARSSLQQKGYEIVKLRPEMNSAVVESRQMETADTSVEALEALAAEPDIRYAEPNYRYYALSTRHPDDEHFGMQWHYPQIRLPQAWSRTTGDSSVQIAVVDTGANLNHPDLGDNIAEAAGYNVIEDSDDFTDANGHGTHVTGTIAANTNNNEGIAGVMWDSTVVPIKALGDGGSGTLDDIAAAIYYAAGLSGEAPAEYASMPENPYPADIINLSLGGYGGSQHLEEAVNDAAEAGALLVAASGNDGLPQIMYPAAYDEVLAVGAIDFNYPHEPTRTGYTNYGPGLDVLAPGGDVNTDSNNNGYRDGVWSTFFDEEEYFYRVLEGTSMAAPHVSGVLGLMLARGISAHRAEEILKNTAMEIETADYSFGLVNAYWAINEVDSMELRLLDKDQNIVKNKTLPAETNDFKLEEIPPGEYQLEVVIDVSNNGSIDSGDYHGMLDEIEAAPAAEKEVNITLQEQE